MPCGEPEDYGWFRQDDVRGWTRLFTRAGFFVEDHEVYELTGRRLARFAGARFGGLDRTGEIAARLSRLCCSARELSPRRLRRLLTPSGIERTARRRAPTLVAPYGSDVTRTG